MHLLWGLLLLLSLAGTNLSQPRMQLFPAKRAELVNRSATVVCSVKGFYPDDITVEWWRDEQRLEQGMHTWLKKFPKKQTYMISSQLTVPASDWISHEIYSCTIHHKSLPRPLGRAVSAKDRTAQ